MRDYITNFHLASQSVGIFVDNNIDTVFPYLTMSYNIFLGKESKSGKQHKGENKLKHISILLVW